MSVVTELQRHARRGPMPRDPLDLVAWLAGVRRELPFVTVRLDASPHTDRTASEDLLRRLRSVGLWATALEDGIHVVLPADAVLVELLFERLGAPQYCPSDVSAALLAGLHAAAPAGPEWALPARLSPTAAAERGFRREREMLVLLVSGVRLEGGTLFATAPTVAALCPELDRLVDGLTPPVPVLARASARDAGVPAFRLPWRWGGRRVSLTAGGDTPRIGAAADDARVWMDRLNRAWRRDAPIVEIGWPVHRSVAGATLLSAVSGCVIQVPEHFFTCRVEVEVSDG